MALLEDLVCSECSKSFKGVKTKNHGSICTPCFELEEKERKNGWIEAHTKGKTTEEIVNWLLGFVYDHLEDIEKIDMKLPFSTEIRRI